MFQPASFVIVLYFCTQLPAGPPKESGATDNEGVAWLLDFLRKTDPDVARKTWTYERLVGSSDAVLIGEFTEKQQVELAESDASSLHGSQGVVALESRFEVLAVLRPDKKWERHPKSVRVLHSKSPQLLDFSTPIFRRPSIAVVTPERITLNGVGQPIERISDQPFLMFLSARPDGRYQPVTGQYFPGLSFRRIVHPFYASEGVMYSSEGAKYDPERAKTPKE